MYLRKITTQRIRNMGASVQDEAMNVFGKARSYKVSASHIKEINALYRKMNLQTLITFQ